MPARLVQLSVAEGDEVPAGAELAVLEAMKMEHVLAAPHAGRVTRLLAVPGGYLGQGQPLLVLEPIAGEAHVRADDATAHDPAASAPTCSACWTATPSRSTPPAPRPWPGATPRAAAARARTWPICATRAASSNTARWRLPRRRAAAAWTT
jgi:pyruvate/2-oxoglutarate dehydrogenase complex dihydrolipoamide acyltransferase (E2) component